MIEDPTNVSISEIISLRKIQTKVFQGQKPGTSGLRKKVKVFSQKNYTQNFIQSYFNALRKDNLSPRNTILVGGDGRYFSLQATAIIIKLACANGVNQIHIAKNLLMSTPACSAYIRKINKQIGNCLGGILLTASHNPGGPDQDFGIKFNSRNGGPAQEDFTNSVYQETNRILQFRTCDYDFVNKIDFDKIGSYVFTNVDRIGKNEFIIRVVENVSGYIQLMKEYFEFKTIKNLFQRKDFNMIFDGMYGAAGPYAKALFINQFGDQAKIINCDPKPDFNKLHPDPNLKCAAELVTQMKINGYQSSKYDFGAACDGDADRNMIVGNRFFVTPSDSLAVLVAFNGMFMKQKLRGIARSMPTSGAVDKVAQKLNIPLYETPTGWKFFGNLMEENLISICGEESFGTGSCHIRQKDGLWTVLAWLQLIAKLNPDQQKPLKSVQQIVQDFWKQYGRNYYCRYDYQNCDINKGKQVWQHLVEQIPKYDDNAKIKGHSFIYTDPVDHSVSQNQGLCFIFEDGSRVIFRQSGTGSVGITIRIYFEKYDKEMINLSTTQALKEIIKFGLELSQIQEITDKMNPDVIT